MSSPLIKYLLAQEVTKYTDFIKDNKDAIKIDNFSTTYNIYNIEYKNILESNIGNKPDFQIKTFECNNFNDMLQLLNEAIQEPNFYGCLSIFDKNPFNILSYNFIQKIQKYKNEKKFLFSLYFLDENINEKVYKYAKDILLNLEINNISINFDTSNVSIYAKADELWQISDDIHLNDLHQNITDKTLNELLTIDENLLWNSDVTDGDEIKSFIVNNDFAIELHVIDNGFLIPSYGWFNKENGIFNNIVGTTRHPNISSCGKNYCTGVNTTYSILGVSELSYGNLNSPLNSNIWLKDSLSIAKAFQEVYWNILINIDLEL